MELPYQQYFDSMPCYVTVQDKDLKVIKANDKFVEDFGSYQGRYCYQVYKNSPDKCDICPVEKTFQDGVTRSSYEKVSCINGKCVDVLVNTTPIKDEQGEIIAVMEMSTDVSDMVEMQNKLKINKDRYQTLFEEVPCYISIQDKDLNIINSNRMFRETFGTYLGCKCYSVYKHREEECLPCVVRQTLEDGEIHKHEEVVTSKDGRAINTMVHTAPIFDENGKITKVMEMSSDITELRNLQDQLTSIGLLISSISHGIKGLLNGLNGGIYLVNKGIENDNKQRLEQGWEIVLRNVQRIKSMVMDILYYAKDREPNLERVQAIEILNETAEIIKEKSEELNIGFYSDIDENAGVLDCDRNAIRAMLINLLENSLDACRVDKSNEQHKVELKIEGKPDTVDFIISDNGIGMDRETKDRAFSLFFSSKGGEGTGLGLFIANKITNAHGGNIQINSEPFKGTSFRVSLPRRSINLSTRDFK